MGEVAHTVPLIIIVGVLVFYFVGASVIGYNLMSSDKMRAGTYQRRISEASMLFVAFIGGAFGEKIAQKWCRHKTKKEPFRTSLNNMVVWNLSLICLICYALWAHTTFVQEIFGTVFVGNSTERPVKIIVNRGLD